MKTGQQSVISIKLLSLQIQLSFLHGLKHRNQFNCWHTTQHQAISLHQSIADPMSQLKKIKDFLKWEIRLNIIFERKFHEIEIFRGPKLLAGGLWC